jgi:hypothetical protein
VEGEGRKHAAAGANTPTCATAQRKSGARRAGRPSTPERSHSTQARPNVKARKTPVSCRDSGLRSGLTLSKARQRRVEAVGHGSARFGRIIRRRPALVNNAG